MVVCIEVHQHFSLLSGCWHGDEPPSQQDMPWEYLSTQKAYSWKMGRLGTEDDLHLS